MFPIYLVFLQVLTGKSVPQACWETVLCGNSVIYPKWESGKEEKEITH